MLILRNFGMVVLVWMATALPGLSADRAKLEAFMEVTGFDVALEGLRVSAHNAPAMVGLDAADFGLTWIKVADEVFEPKQLKIDALNILEKTLSDDVLNHAVEFYASPLGQRLVTAENASHLADDARKAEEGARLAADLMKRGSPQPQYFLDMSDAVGSIDTGIAQFREVQVRFLLAAMAAGLIEADMSEEDLRMVLGQNDDDIRSEVLQNMINSNAFTYRDFSDIEMREYSEALATDEMRELYELMNAVQYTLMADRYEVLASRMAELHPSQEL